MQQSFNADATMRLKQSVVSDDNCLSYFKLPNGKITTQWPWGMSDYHERTFTPDFSDFEFSGGVKEAAE